MRYLRSLTLQLKKCKVNAMGLHNPEELEVKKQAVDIAVESFVMQYMEGFYETNDDSFLYHAIESINQLVVEYKKG